MYSETSHRSVKPDILIEPGAVLPYRKSTTQMGSTSQLSTFLEPILGSEHYSLQPLHQHEFYLYVSLLITEKMLLLTRSFLIAVLTAFIQAVQLRPTVKIYRLLC